jgi:hypothetical protein
VFFGGAPLWHVSVAIWSPLTRTPKPVSSLTDHDKAKAERYAMMTLQGVGIEDRTICEPLNVTMHYRRETTGMERDYVFKTQRGRLASMKHEKWISERLS